MNNVAVEKLLRYFKQYPLTKYKKGSIIYRPDEPIEHIAFVKKGYVRLYVVNSDGDERTLNLFKPIFFLTLLFAITNTSNHYYMEAVTDVYLWKAPKKRTIEFIRQDSVLLFELVTRIMDGLKKVLSNLEHMTTGDSHKKICGLLVSFATEYGVTADNGITIELQTTHNLIASLTGLTRETVTTRIDKLVKSGLISRQNKTITVHDIDRLRKEAGLT
ncbi:MAG: Crp/Fnr family transcriptional regulator [Patescibacteria group bacterium]